MREPNVDAREALRAQGFRGSIRLEESLAPLTTWRIGGPAEILAEPKDVEDLQHALAWATDHGVRWRILGNGSNLLVRDEGVRGLVLRVRRVLDAVTWEGSRVIAGAGALFPVLARQAAARGLSGLEFGAGIPGTVGGAIVMNAGWHQYEIGRSVESVQWLDATGTSHTIGLPDCDFGYRHSRFRDETGIVLSAELKLVSGDAGEITRRMEGFAESRKDNQPTELPSCGSVFVQPPGDFAGRLIDEAGLKGLRVGQIQVSPKHANFFVNLGGASSAEALELVETIERKVKEAFGTSLTREFELW